MANRLGHSMSITSFGESHGPLTGIVLDGFPGGFEIDLNNIAKELARRKPGQSHLSSSRNEPENFRIVSGIFEGKSSGTPITILIDNIDQRPSDYDALRDIYRPGHADRTYDLKYGIRDHRGGGRSSARVTAAWVAAGAIIKQYLAETNNIHIQSVVSSVGKIKVQEVFELDWSHSENNVLRCPDINTAKEMESLINTCRNDGDSVGGIISTRISNVPAGLGEPLFDKLNAEIAKAIFSLNAVKGLEFGSGFAGTERKGSENNDTPGSGRNNDGGISGGISNGQEILFNTAFKPVSSISMSQNVLNTEGEIKQMNIQGRHDPCVLPRAVPIIESLAALVIADHLQMNLKYKK